MSNLVPHFIQLIQLNHSSYFLAEHDDYSTCFTALLDDKVCPAKKFAIFNNATVKLSHVGSPFGFEKHPPPDLCRWLHCFLLIGSQWQSLPLHCPLVAGLTTLSPKLIPPQLWMSGTPTQGNGWMSRMYMPCNVHGKVKHNPEWRTMWTSVNLQTAPYCILSFYFIHRVYWRRKFSYGPYPIYFIPYWKREDTDNLWERIEIHPVCDT